MGTQKKALLERKSRLKKMFNAAFPLGDYIEDGKSHYRFSRKKYNASKRNLFLEKIEIEIEENNNFLSIEKQKLNDINQSKDCDVKCLNYRRALINRKIDGLNERIALLEKAAKKTKMHSFGLCEKTYKCINPYDLFEDPARKFIIIKN